jgi:Zn-dependent protease
VPAAWVYEHFGDVAPASALDRLYLRLTLAELGRFAEAGAYATDAIRLAEPTHHAFSVGWAHYTAGLLHLFTLADRSHNPWREADRKAAYGESVRAV